MLLVLKVIVRILHRVVLVFQLCEVFVAEVRVNPILLVEEVDPISDPLHVEVAVIGILYDIFNVIW